MAKKKKKEEIEEDHLELSEEELEEERQDTAARLIQTAYRRKMASDLLKAMIRQNFVKLKDRDTGVYYYKNRTSGEIVMRKPRILGDGDLPTPRDFQAPKEYDPGYSDLNGFALIITVNTFTSERLPNLGGQVEADHALFEHLLSHDFICKFSGENVISLKNPSITSFKDSLDRLRKMVKKKGFLFIYICTHVVTIETKVVKDDCFFCFRDTVWKSTDQAAKSSMSLSEMCHLINILGVDRKVIAVNFAHVRATPKSIFKSRYIYPPPNTLTRMADLCNCAVLGSCNVGTYIPDMQEHTPTSQLTSQRRGALKIGSGAAAGTLPSVAPGKDGSDLSGSFRNGDDIQHIAVVAKRDLAANIVAQYQKKWMEGKENETDELKLQKPKQPGLKWRKETSDDAKQTEADEKSSKKEVDEKKSPEEDGNETKTKKSLPHKKKKRKKEKTEEEVKAEKEAKEAKLNEAAMKSLEEKEEDAVNDLGIKIALPSSKEVRGYITQVFTFVSLLLIYG